MNFFRLKKFVVEVTEQLEPSGAMPAGLPDALAELVRYRDWLPPAFSAPADDRYRQYLLHCDPLDRFSLVSFVWMAGQQTPIHDHGVWGAIGQLQGHEESTSYSLADGELAKGKTTRSGPGDVIAFNPVEGDIHRVVNPGPDIAISIHVYGANIGAAERCVFDLESNAVTRFVSGYDNDTLPNFY